MGERERRRVKEPGRRPGWEEERGLVSMLKEEAPGGSTSPGRWSEC